jgi:hypothetical protein
MQGWNYIDLGAPLMLLWILISDYIAFLQGGTYVVDRSLLASCTFFMWIKVLYFLRIFKATGYLIRMITSVAYGMRVFLLILAITLAAFGDAMLRISLANPNESAQGDDNPRFI